MKTKKCYRCGKRLSINKFYKASGNVDGYTNDCRTCRNEARRANYYKKVTGKLDVVKDVKAPKLNTDVIQKAIQECKTIGDIIQYRINNFNRVKLQRNISIIINLLVVSSCVYLLIK